MRDYTAGNPFDALTMGCYNGGKLKYVGKVRAGFVPHMRCAMMPLLEQLRIKECPFCVDLPERTANSLFADQRGNAELPVVKAGARRADRVCRVDAGWALETFTVWRLERRQRRAAGRARIVRVFPNQICYSPVVKPPRSAILRTAKYLY
jgi:hypothetical protein